MQQVVKKNDPLQMSKDELKSVKTFEAWDSMDDITCRYYKMDMKERAKELGFLSDMNKLIKDWEAEYRRVRTAAAKLSAPKTNMTILLDTDDNGKAKSTIDNFMLVIDSDKKFSGLRFNEISYSPENTVDGKAEKWSDADDSKSRHYLEKTYDLYSLQKYDDASRIKFKKSYYNPIKDIIEAVKWDGVDRIKTLFIKWLKCEDTDYAREVTRLVFAGGIHRLYNPGCKFDDMAVLIGTKQGEGKSTFVRWLAIKDDYFREVKKFEGQEGVESLEGGWICEVSEMLAVTKTKDQEAVKGFLSALSDTYRRPYDKRVTTHPRRCLFVGTTNKTQFLVDKTGNRRFYPLVTRQIGYDIFNNESSIKNEILQCWAEAKAKLGTSEMQPFARFDMVEAIRDRQHGAMEEDYREGMIESFVKNRDEVFIIQIWAEVIGDTFTKPTRKESNEIATMLQTLGFEGCGKKDYGNYRRQKQWVRIGSKNDYNNDSLPFE